MRKYGLFLAILLLTLAMPVRAQISQEFDTVNLDIWPEYDKPGVLVIYHVTLSSSMRLPAEITMRIPEAASAPSAVAEQNADGLFNVPYQEVDRDNRWITIRFTVAFPQFQMEFYDPTLSIEGPDHDYTFRWPGDAAVNTLNVIVQQPRTASGLTLQPSSGTQTVGNDGLIYLTVPVGPVKLGDDFALTLTYQKTDDSLTRGAEAQQVTAVLPSSQTIESPAIPGSTAWILGTLGALMIAGAIFWYLLSSHRLSAPSLTKAAKRKSKRVFCHQCGQQAGEEDVFCRACGTKLRR